MKIVVTGNLGYIGPLVVKRLRALGRVTGIDTGWFLPHYAGQPVYPHVQHFLDIRDPRAKRIVAKADVVVHLAGLSNDPMGDLDPALTRSINYDGTVGLLRAAPDARHVIVSSCSVYGHTDTLATERTLPNPLTEYARCKADVDAAATEGLIDAVSLRLGTVWGWSPGFRTDLVVNRMVRDAVAGSLVTVTGNAWRPLVHVEDVARAVEHFVTRLTGPVNIVGANVQMGDLGWMVAGALGVGVMELPNSTDARDYAADGSLAASAGWQPTRPLVAQEIERLACWLRDPFLRVTDRLPVAKEYIAA